MTKLLLSLNEEDPAGALLCVDYYALRAKEYDFVESLVAEHAMQSVSTALIPGLAFSRAMAARLKAEQGSRQRPRGQGGRLGEPSNEGMAASALPSPDEMLQAAVMMFPATIPRLLTRLVEAGKRNHCLMGLKLNKGASAIHLLLCFSHLGMRDEGWWSGVRMSAPFVDCEPVASTSLDRLLTIFIERHHLLWKVRSCCVHSELLSGWTWLPISPCPSRAVLGCARILGSCMPGCRATRSECFGALSF